MSFGNELYEEMMIDQWIAEEEESQRIEAGQWKKKDGSVIQISDMSESHIQNCLAMIKRNRDDDNAMNWIKLFEAELNKRAGFPALKPRE